MMASLLVEIRNKIPILDNFEPGLANKTPRHGEKFESERTGSLERE